MTSNVGAREIAQRGLGFGDISGSRAGEGEKAMERLFSPEFRNRLDARIQFRPLTPEVMEQIVDKMIRQLSDLLAEKKVTIELTPAARQRLAEKGFDPAFGARPLGRVIEDSVKRPLTEELLFGTLQNGGTAVIDVEADGDGLAVRSAA
jgi:ATP-dependent Clp protease ATP-binding subunit ClpA